MQSSPLCFPREACRRAQLLIDIFLTAAGQFDKDNKYPILGRVGRSCYVFKNNVTISFSSNYQCFHAIH